MEATDGPARRRRGRSRSATATSRRTVSTVDDLDQPEGPTTVVLALSDLFLTPPIVGPLRLRRRTRKLLPDPVNA